MFAWRTTTWRGCCSFYPAPAGYFRMRESFTLYNECYSLYNYSLVERSPCCPQVRTPGVVFTSDMICEATIDRIVELLELKISGNKFFHIFIQLFIFLILTFLGRSACPNYPQIIILDFISSCQKLVHWELQKGKQIGEWWKQVIAKVHIVRNGIIELNNFRIYLVKLKSTASCKHCLCFSISWSLLQPTDH